MTRQAVSSYLWRSPSVVRLASLLGPYMIWREATVGLDLYPGSSSKILYCTVISGVNPSLVDESLERDRYF